MVARQSKWSKLQMARRQQYLLQLVAQSPNITYEEMAASARAAGLASENYNRSLCRRNYLAALRGFRDEATVDRLRSEQQFRINEATRAVMPGVTAGDVGSVRALVALMQREADLNQLDPTARTPLEIANFIEQLSALAVAGVSFGMAQAALTVEQRQALLDGIRHYYAGVDNRKVIELRPAETA